MQRKLDVRKRERHDSNGKVLEVSFLRCDNYFANVMCLRKYGKWKIIEINTIYTNENERTMRKERRMETMNENYDMLAMTWYL
jgi:hypothetical protein